MGTGLVLLLAAAPVLLLVALFLKLFRRGKVLCVRRVVRLPGRSDRNRWPTFGLWSFAVPSPDPAGAPVSGLRHFLLQFLPGLMNVARGHLYLVGLPPRTPEQVKDLSADWQALYLPGLAGLVSESLLTDGPLTADDQFAAEGAYALTAGWADNLRLLGRYLAAILLFRRLWDDTGSSSDAAWGNQLTAGAVEATVDGLETVDLRAGDAPTPKPPTGVSAGPHRLPPERAPGRPAAIR
jgi:hypothetical protein